MNVELLPCVARRHPISGAITKEFDQWWLHVDGMRIGVVPKKKGGHIAITTRMQMSDEYLAEVKREVERLIGERSGVSVPAIPVDTEDEDDES